MEVSTHTNLQHSHRLTVVIDAIRNNAIDETKAVCETSGLPYFVTAMSKGFDETMPTFGGVYGGGGSLPEIKKCVEGSDAILYIGRFAVRDTLSRRDVAR